MSQPQGKPISEKEAEVMIDRYKSGKVPFKPGKEDGCINAVAFGKDELIKFLMSDDNDSVRICPAGHEDGVPTVVIQTYNLNGSKDSSGSNSFNDGLTCPPFPQEVCDPG